MTLRTYAPMRRVSKKVAKALPDFRAVYKVVDARSEGRCEYVAPIAAEGMVDPYGQPLQPGHRLLLKICRCTKRASDHHHLYKPRRSHHDPALIVALCRHHHDRCAWPFKRGRLIINLLNSRHVFELVFASDKFSARRTLAVGLLLLALASPALAAEPTNPAAPLPQPSDTQARHWTAKRFYTQGELRQLQHHRIPIDRLDYLEASGGEGGSAGTGPGSSGGGGATPGTVGSL